MSGRLFFPVLVLAAALASAGAAEAFLSASPSSIDFGTVRIGNYAWTSVWIQNNSAEPAQHVMTWSPAAFAFRTWGDCTGYLPAWGSCHVRVEFQPNAEGFYSDSFRVDSSNQGQAFIWLRGYGKKSGASKEAETF